MPATMATEGGRQTTKQHVAGVNACAQFAVDIGEKTVIR